MNDNNGEKEEIHVFINMGGHPLARKTPDGKGHEGILYDIWKLMRVSLEDKYTFVEHFDTRTNYDQITKDVASGKYDIAIAHFQLTDGRMRDVNFTNNLIIGKNTILHLPKLAIGNQIVTILKNVILKPLILLLISGVILGLVLHMFEPNRHRKANAKNKFAIRRTIATVIASLFGEAGFLSENSTLSYSGLFTVLFILTFAFFFVMVLQAYVTEKVLDMNKGKYYNTSNIKDKILLSPKGYAVAKFMERYGAKIEYHEKTVPELIDVYLKNPDKYIGISLAYFDALGNERPDIGLLASQSDFGFKEVCWLVDKNKPQLLKDLNFAMLPIQFNLDPYNICKKYMDQKDVYLCNL